ncbi:MAG: Txe/YoeB family addiction module toxin [Prevotella sp.]|nr:Txe/YoeB family addiction module toxin [Prevotella sp.]
MRYTLVLSDEALKGLDKWKRSGQMKILLKIARIFDELEEHPYVGIGHPEPLKGGNSDKWSRQIDKKNRIVYTVKDMILQVDVITVIGHYEDK